MTRTFHTHPSTVPLDAEKPLLIVDADEVILRFADGFDRFLAERELFLDLTTYRLHGNVKRKDNRAPVLDVEVTALLDEFRADLDWLDAVEDAVDVLRGLEPLMNIVVLSNVSETQAPARLRNFEKLGLPFPLISNSGPKGPFVKALAARAKHPAFFIDDIPMHHASVAEGSPGVLRIHLIGDERLKSLLPVTPHAHLRAETWRDADAFIRAKLAEAP
ncbi:MAG: hypothetical protein JSR55_01590 [Proteobacteria bacterium]|nr:hypothetical protein [Pseudomonadota bacterium]